MSSETIPIQEGGVSVEVEFSFEKLSMNAMKAFSFSVHLLTNCGKQYSDLFEYSPESKSAILKKKLKSNIIVFPDRVNLMELLLVTDGISKSQSGKPKMIGRVVLECREIMSQKQVKFVNFLSGGPDKSASISYSFNYQIKQPANLFTIQDIQACQDIDIKLANKLNKLDLNLNMNETLLSVASVNNSFDFAHPNGDFAKKDDHVEAIVMNMPNGHNLLQPSIVASTIIHEPENHAINQSVNSLDVSEISVNDSTFFQNDQPNFKALQQNVQKYAVGDITSTQQNKQLELEINGLKFALSNEKEQVRQITSELEKMKSVLNAEKMNNQELNKTLGVLKNDLAVKENMCATLYKELREKQDVIENLQELDSINKQLAIEINRLKAELSTGKEDDQSLQIKDQIIADLKGQLGQANEQIEVFSIQMNMLEDGQKKINSDFESFCRSQASRLQDTLDLINQDLGMTENGHNKNHSNFQRANTLPAQIANRNINGHPADEPMTDFHRNSTEPFLGYQEPSIPFNMQPNATKVFNLVSELEKKTNTYLINTALLKSLTQQQHKQIEELTSQTKMCETMISDLQMQISAKEDQNAKFETKLQETNTMLAQKDALVSSYQQKLTDAESNVNHSSLKMAEISQQKALFEGQVLEWQIKFRNLELEKNNLVQEHTAYQNECTQLRRDLAQLHTQVETKNAQISDLQYSIDMIHQKMKEQANSHLEMANSHSSLLIEREKVT